MIEDVKKALKIGSITVFFLLIIIYGLITSSDLLFGIKIKNVAINNAEIVDGATYRESVVSISGVAENAISITLNGREISIDQDGNWNESVALIEGYNVISIVAKDKFGSVDEKNYQLMYLK